LHQAADTCRQSLDTSLEQIDFLRVVNVLEFGIFHRCFNIGHTLHRITSRVHVLVVNPRLHLSQLHLRSFTLPLELDLGFDQGRLKRFNSHRSLRPHTINSGAVLNLGVLELDFHAELLFFEELLELSEGYPKLTTVPVRV